MGIVVMATKQLVKFRNIHENKYFSFFFLCLLCVWVHEFTSDIYESKNNSDFSEWIDTLTYTYIPFLLTSLYCVGGIQGKFSSPQRLLVFSGSMLVNIVPAFQFWEIYSYQTNHLLEDWRSQMKNFIPFQHYCFYYVLFLPVFGAVIELIARYLNRSIKNRICFVYALAFSYGIPYMLSFMQLTNETTEQSHIQGVWPLQPWYTHLVMAHLCNSKGPLNDFVQGACIAVFLVSVHNTGTMQVFCMNTVQI